MAKKSVKPNYNLGDKNPYNFQDPIPYYHDNLKTGKGKKKKGGK